MPACSSGSLTNVLPHRNAMLKTQDTTSHPVQYTDTGPTCRCAHTGIHSFTFKCLGKAFTDFLHTQANAQLYDAVRVVVSRQLGRMYRINQVLNPGPVVCESITLSARSRLLCLMSLQRLRDVLHIVYVNMSLPFSHHFLGQNEVKVSNPLYLQCISEIQTL